MEDIMITAKIKKDPYGTGLWLEIEHPEDGSENTLWSITEEEVEPIMNVCKKYLEKKK
jgi:hypothetical protein